MGNKNKSENETCNTWTMLKDSGLTWGNLEVLNLTWDDLSKTNIVEK